MNEFYRVLTDYGHVLEESESVGNKDAIACILVIIPPSYRNQLVVQIMNPVLGAKRRSGWAPGRNTAYYFV